MSTRKYLDWSIGVSVAGTAFSGYLSLTRLTSGICAFAEPCPFFLGHPACYTGFALFATALVVSVVARIMRRDSTWPALVNGVLGVAGMLFAGHLTIEELASHGEYRLGLPTCAYGFAFFAALVVLSLAGMIDRRAPTATT